MQIVPCMDQLKKNFDLPHRIFFEQEIVSIEQREEVLSLLHRLASHYLENEG